MATQQQPPQQSPQQDERPTSTSCGFEQLRSLGSVVGAAATRLTQSWSIIGHTNASSSSSAELDLTPYLSDEPLSYSKPRGTGAYDAAITAPWSEATVTQQQEQLCSAIEALLLEQQQRLERARLALTRHIQRVLAACCTLAHRLHYSIPAVWKRTSV